MKNSKVGKVQPLGPETLEAMQTCFAEVARRATRSDALTSPATVAKEFAKMQDLFLTPAERARLAKPPLFPGSRWDDPAWNLLTALMTRPEFHPVHLVRFALLTGAIEALTEDINHRFVRMAEAYRSRHPLDLKTIGDTMKAAGMNSEAIGRYYLWDTGAEWKPFRWGTAAVQPYFAEHPGLLNEALATNDRRKSRAHTNALEVLAQFAQLPDPIIEPLWNIVWTGPKPERPLAQLSLEKVGDCVGRVMAALQSKSAETRAAAASWLGRIANPSCRNALLDAVKKESDDLARCALMSALERLGVPLRDYFSRQALLVEATAGLAKKQPKELQWFPFDQLPIVHWADDGRRVDARIVHWWIVQGCLAKHPQGSALLHRLAEDLVPAEREALGQFVLEAWIAMDTTAGSDKKVTEAAREVAVASKQRAQQSYATLAEEVKSWSNEEREEIEPELRRLAAEANVPLETMVEQQIGWIRQFGRVSAIGIKGALSVAAAMCGPAAVPVIRRYLNEWHGLRAAQCCALVQVLGRLDHPQAIQLLLAVGTRFRTKSIQQEAGKQVQLLAARKGWTVEQMADRTVPTAGLDERGTLLLDFGSRQFTARLTPALELELFDAENKLLKALPDPRKGDTAAKASAAKKTLAAARKELKSIVLIQQTRLFEAMCTQRSWRFADWNLYLNQHPILRHFCQRLAWMVLRQGRVAVAFRALPDQSLTDASDTPVRLDADDEVRLVHASLIPETLAKEWSQHFADYNVEPVFNQLDSPAFRLDSKRQEESEIAEFQGHLLEGLKLRRKANARGYIHGQSGEASWFTEYQKHFASLGMTAIIEFTGNTLPERNLTVALKTLCFLRTDPSAGRSTVGGMPLSLGEVPPVLLSECCRDIRQIAAEGLGFDPEWEKKTQM